VTRRFEKVAVLGLGLLGGSVALAARERGLAVRVAGASRRREVLDAALERGAIDEAAGYEGAVSGADLIVLATPVFAMADVARAIATSVSDGAVLTDVGSVKGVLAETLPGLLPRGIRYVGSHPMAGSHHRGFEYARADLFEGAPCIVAAGGDADAQERVCDFWRALGARVVLRDPTVHDAQVAWMSHVPHVLAFAFAGALRASPDGVHEVAGSGFRDFTRIAHSDPELWGDILTANRKAIASPLHAVAEALSELGRAVESGDAESVERWIAEARAALSSVASQAAVDSPSAGCEGRTSADSTPALGGAAGPAEAEDSSTSHE
jgi:cyclohexadieny/prephenate dehydrogenase